MTDGSTWRCAIDGCDGPKHPKAGKGMCKRHYERARLAARTSVTCEAEGCRKQTKSDTLCKWHRWERSPITSLCSSALCEERTYVNGLCASHYQRSSKYGLSPEAYEEILATQGGGCGICGITQQESPHSLVVDHDHSCCPGKRTCGRCIRGVLCRACNVGIGNMNDDAARLLAAHKYLSR